MRGLNGRIGEIESEPDPDRIASLLKGALAALENGAIQSWVWYLAVNRVRSPPLDIRKKQRK